MTNVIDFHQYKIDKCVDNTTEPTDARGVCYLSVIKNLIQLLVYFQQKYGFVFIFSGTKIVPYSSVQMTPSNFFVRLPEMISHGLRIQGSFRNPFMNNFRGEECSKKKFRAELIFSFLKEYKDGMFNVTLQNILHMYCFDCQCEESSNQVVYSFKGGNNSQNMTLIFTWEDSDDPQVPFEIEFKLWVPVTGNQFEDLDHIYALDVVTYSQHLLRQFVPGISCF